MMAVPNPIDAGRQACLQPMRCPFSEAITPAHIGLNTRPNKPIHRGFHGFSLVVLRLEIAGGGIGGGGEITPEISCSFFMRVNPEAACSLMASSKRLNQICLPESSDRLVFALERCLFSLNQNVGCANIRKWDIRSKDTESLVSNMEQAMEKSVHSANQKKLQRLLRGLREAKELRQEDVAEALEVPQSFVSKIESGERRLDILELREVCEVLGISLAKFCKQLEEAIAG